MPKQGAIKPGRVTVQGIIPDALDEEFRKQMAARRIRKVSEAVTQAITMWNGASAGPASKASTPVKSTAQSGTTTDSIATWEWLYTVIERLRKIQGGQSGIVREIEAIVAQLNEQASVLSTSEPDKSVEIAEAIEGKGDSEIGGGKHHGTYRKRRKN